VKAQGSKVKDTSSKVKGERLKVKGFWLLRLLGLLSLLRSGFPQNELKDERSKVKGERVEAQSSKGKGQRVLAIAFIRPFIIAAICFPSK